MYYGPEFRSRAFVAWAYRQQIQVLYIRPGKPIENAFIESFNGRLRDECLSVSWFLDLDDARVQIEAWRIDYNTARPHRRLAGRTPSLPRNARALPLQPTHNPRSSNRGKVRETDDGIWSLSFNTVLLARFDERDLVLHD